MALFMKVHPLNPQQRLIHQIVEVLNKNGVIVYPTDASYALGCRIDSKQAAERISEIRQMDQDHNFTLVCKDLSEISNYAYVDNSTFRLLKAYTPGPYTFVLPATSEVPRRLLNKKLKTIGIRIPDNLIAQAIIDELGTPIMSVTLILPGEDYPMSAPELIEEQLHNEVDIVIAGGPCSLFPTSVIDLTQGAPVVIRRGAGDTSPFE